MTDKKIIPFSPPDISENEVQGVIEALKSGWITTGPKTKEFEKKIAEFCGTSKAVCLNSATACEESILRFLGIQIFYFVAKFFNIKGKFRQVD